MFKLLDHLNQIDTSIIDTKFSKEDFVKIDLSINNEDLKNTDVSSSEELGKYVDAFIKKNHAKVAFGGYLEKRNIYDRSGHFNTDSRNIHLGIDIWQKAGTVVLAPLDGEIHSFNNNKNYGDYGPTIILKHTSNDTSFYTLYGHLSLESIKTLNVGQQFKSGDVLAHFGDPSENGDYPPHLHFQIILDMKDNKGDFPGVASESTLDSFKLNCPDPNILLKI